MIHWLIARAYDQSRIAQSLVGSPDSAQGATLFLDGHLPWSFFLDPVPHAYLARARQEQRKG